MNEAKRDQVFISYAHENLETVKNVVFGLKKRKLRIWFDKEHLAPGRWKTQIIKAITRSRYFVVCISEAALRKTGDKPGFQDNELQTAYEIAQAQPDQEFTIVPVRLEGCERGDFRVRSFQQYDLFHGFEEGLDRLAIDMGGISLADANAKDERTEEMKELESLRGGATLANYAKDYEKAVFYYDSILNISPNNYDAWHGKGEALSKLDRYEEALSALERSIEIKPNSKLAWYNKSQLLLKMRRFTESKRAFDKSVEL